MANAVAEYDCAFHWKIKNPYVPSRTFEAVFVYGSKTPLHWKVILRPVFRDYSRMVFSGCLRYLYLEDSEDTHVHTDRFEIKVWANRRKVLDKEVRRFTFESENTKYDFEFPFPLQLGYCHQHATECDYMKVAVNISFKRQNIVNREGNRNYYLNIYSQNLKALLVESWGSLYSNLKLKSWDEPSSPFQVHSCIISVRWDNFFNVHPGAEITDRTVETGISHDVLKEILVYVYSGEHFQKVARDERLTTELWKVVDKYEMYDILRMFMRGDSVQNRFDSYHCIKSAHFFDVSALRFQPFKCSMNSGTDYEVGFEFRICLGNTNSFSYSLLSRSRHNLNARVILEFARFIPVDGPRREMIFSGFHAEDYEIESNGRVESGTCSIEAFQSTILVTLCLSDGTKVVAIEGDDSNVKSLDDQFHLLSDHMSVLLRHLHYDFDLQIICPTHDPTVHLTHNLHKAIFVARVPNWKAVLKDIPEEVTLEHAIPDVVRCDVRCIPFAYIVGSIYTGEFVHTPVEFIESVLEFAHKGGLAFLDPHYFALISQCSSNPR